MKLANRWIDIVLSSVLLLVALPILCCILFITWWQLRCNVIFAEKRVGKNGILFVMYKVTTMKPTVENLAARSLGPIKKNDPRLTRFSQFLRRYSLDEIPQFFNVIRGDMSLVGPRPELPKAAEKWGLEFPDYFRRLVVSPGMTGWAQVNGYRKGYIEPETRLKHDLFYISNMSILFDLWIIILTPKAIIKYEIW